MGTACSCARATGDDGAHKDKATNGHVQENGVAEVGAGSPRETADHSTQTAKNGNIPRISIGGKGVGGSDGDTDGESAVVSPALTSTATPPLTSPALATPMPSPALTSPPPASSAPTSPYPASTAPTSPNLTSPYPYSPNVKSSANLTSPNPYSSAQNSSPGLNSSPAPLTPMPSPAFTSSPALTSPPPVTSPALTSPPVSSLRADSGLDHDFVEEDMMAGELATLVGRLETAVTRLEKIGTGGSAAPSGTPSQDAQDDECTLPMVLAYDDLLSGSFKAFMDTSAQIGGDVDIMAKMVQSSFINQRAFLVMSSKSQRPLDSELPQVLEPTGKKIQEIIAFRESKRQSPYFNHLSAISESIPGLSWVAVSPAPAPYVKEMGDSAVFYTNRVLKDYKDKDRVHVEWVQNWNNVFKDLQAYVRTHHTTGLSWNTRGGNAMKNLKTPPANCGVPPPPPPGIPPPPPMIDLSKAAAPADNGHAALFASLNKGTEITSGLKKVSDDMKTHKNPSLREGPKPFVKHTPSAGKSTPANATPDRPPKFVLEGKKWLVEYQKDNPNLIIDKARMDQTVYIYKCQNIVVQVKGKCNSIILDSCKKSAVVFENLVSSTEVVNCQSCKVQVMGVMPTISIEKTDGCHVYLSKDSLNTEIISAKSSEMNILIPKEDGEFVECPIPEQFKTLVKGLSLVTTCAEKAG